MSAPPPIAPVPEDRHGRILAELAGLALELSRDLQARALAADSVEDATKLAAAFQRTARAVRQCLALEAKLVHDRAREARAQAEARLKLDQHRRRAAACQIVPPPSRPRPDREWENLYDDLHDDLDAFDDDLDELLVPPELPRAPPKAPLTPAEAGTPAEPGEAHRVPTRPSAWAPASAGASGGGGRRVPTPAASPPPPPNSS